MPNQVCKGWWLAGLRLCFCSQEALQHSVLTAAQLGRLADAALVKLTPVIGETRLLMLCVFRPIGQDMAS